MTTSGTASSVNASEDDDRAGIDELDGVTTAVIAQPQDAAGAHEREHDQHGPERPGTVRMKHPATNASTAIAPASAAISVHTAEFARGPAPRGHAATANIQHSPPGAWRTVGSEHLGQQAARPSA